MVYVNFVNNYSDYVIILNSIFSLKNDLLKLYSQFVFIECQGKWSIWLEVWSTIYLVFHLHQIFLQRCFGIQTFPIDDDLAYEWCIEDIFVFGYKQMYSIKTDNILKHMPQLFKV